MSLNVVIAKSAFPRFSSLVGILCRPMLGGVFPGQVRVRSWVKKVKNQIISNGTFNSIGDINCTFSKNYVWIKKLRNHFILNSVLRFGLSPLMALKAGVHASTCYRLELPAAICFTLMCCCWNLFASECVRQLSFIANVSIVILVQNILFSEIYICEVSRWSRRKFWWLNVFLAFVTRIPDPQLCHIFCVIFYSYYLWCGTFNWKFSFLQETENGLLLGSPQLHGYPQLHGFL